MSLSSLQLEAFYHLAQTHHFTRAAERMNVTQSALSQRISNLEAELETTLFIRDRAGVRLTDVGIELLRYCQLQSGLETEFLAKLKTKGPGELAGKIRVGAFSSVMHSVLVPALSPLLAEHESVRLSGLTRELYELAPLLQSGEVDFIILDHKWNREGIAAVTLGKERNVLIEKKNYEGPDIYLDHDEEDQVTAAYFKSLKKKWSGQRHYLDDIHGILNGVRFGLGRAVVPLHLCKDDADFRILNPHHRYEVPLVLHHYEQPFYSKLHLAIVKTLTERCELFL